LSEGCNLKSNEEDYSAQKGIFTCATMDIIDTQRPAAPTPATTLPKIRKTTEGEIAQNKLPISKMPIETRNTGLAAVIERTLPRKSIRAAWSVKCNSFSTAGRKEVGMSIVPGARNIH
jgi:hypothetical protein